MLMHRSAMVSNQETSVRATHDSQQTTATTDINTHTSSTSLSSSSDTVAVVTGDPDAAQRGVLPDPQFSSPAATMSVETGLGVPPMILQNGLGGTTYPQNIQMSFRKPERPVCTEMELDEQTVPHEQGMLGTHGKTKQEQQQVGADVSPGKERSPQSSSDLDCLCAVCGEKASGNFFGAMVCLPCKSFFIRCTKDGEPALQRHCLGQCDVSKQLRNRCQYCRFQRCLQIGMGRKEKPVVVHPEAGQELCRVCGDLANGVHFGVFTCEGCKKFFRRGLKEHRSYVCRGCRGCQINPRNRNTCRYCRFEKCLAVGMSRDAIKMGRPRKIFLQSGELSNHSQSSPLAADDGDDDSVRRGKSSPPDRNAFAREAAAHPFNSSFPPPGLYHGGVGLTSSLADHRDRMAERGWSLAIRPQPLADPDVVGQTAPHGAATDQTAPRAAGVLASGGAGDVANNLQKVFPIKPGVLGENLLGDGVFGSGEGSGDISPTQRVLPGMSAAAHIVNTHAHGVNNLNLPVTVNDVLECLKPHEQGLTHATVAGLNSPLKRDPPTSTSHSRRGIEPREARRHETRGVNFRQSLAAAALEKPCLLNFSRGHPSSTSRFLGSVSRPLGVDSDSAILVNESDIDEAWDMSTSMSYTSSSIPPRVGMPVSSQSRSMRSEAHSMECEDFSPASTSAAGMTAYRNGLRVPYSYNKESLQNEPLPSLQKQRFGSEGSPEWSVGTDKIGREPPTVKKARVSCELGSNEIPSQALSKNDTPAVFAQEGAAAAVFLTESGTVDSRLPRKTSPGRGGGERQVYKEYGQVNMEGRRDDEREKFETRRSPPGFETDSSREDASPAAAKTDRTEARSVSAAAGTAEVSRYTGKDRAESGADTLPMAMSNPPKPWKSREGFFTPYLNEDAMHQINDMFVSAYSVLEAAEGHGCNLFRMDARKCDVPNEIQLLEEALQTKYNFSPSRLLRFWNDTSTRPVPHGLGLRGGVMPEKYLNILQEINKLFEEVLEQCDETKHGYTPGNVNSQPDGETKWKGNLSRIVRNTKAVTQFAYSIPGMNLIHPNDRSTLVRKDILFSVTLLLSAVEFFDAEKRQFLFFWKTRELATNTPMYTFQQRLQSVGYKAHSLKLDRNECALFYTLCILCHENAEFEDKPEVQLVIQDIFETLVSYISCVLKKDAMERIRQVFQVFPRIRLMGVWHTNLMANMAFDIQHISNDLDKMDLSAK